VSSPDEITVRTAQDLTAALRGLSGRLDGVRQDSEDRDKALASLGRGNRHRIWALGVSLILDVALTVVVSFFAVQAHDASNSAAQTAQATLITCQASNTSRAENLRIWDYLIALSKPPARDTPAQKAAAEKTLAKIQAEVNQAFALRNCQAILRGN
jgi:hypothetical protein